MSVEQRQDFERGLAIIETRAASLNRFLQAYRQLAQMPPPVLRKSALAPIVQRVASLETRMSVDVAPGPEVDLMVDADQLEQMLINLVRNAVEAVREPGNPADSPREGSAARVPGSEPEVVMRWELGEKDLVLTIEDNGPGLLNPSNAFVPFYTTKASGVGIGLSICRSIIEAHGGRLWADAQQPRGAVFRFTLSAHN